MDAIVEAINVVDAWVWGPPMIILLLGSHLYLTIRTKFIQRKLPLAIKLSVTPDPDAEGDISQFGASYMGHRACHCNHGVGGYLRGSEGDLARM